MRRNRMHPLDPLDALMLTAELVSNPMHVGALLILSPPPGSGPTTSTSFTAKHWLVVNR
ncbi:wax ester synthase-like Acyl-CoA acyltransferase domain protein [Mycobacterium ulcerans str. Harvey]|uniref:Wax ester synthase-like Acyl-CoA acyltransferase domain protein n=1 Tax=Mycobacterium ulcerans str. Harvey TaxID=1299332 RepID=A0ABN0QUH2_MYCUL|nr:wax ester synthase-like Acyl-CoA acyltransferase domain protein [Mycobacterium ulcerans str. Harvey]